MTTRSHDQYNTTLYGLDDRYRGVFGQRRVLFMNAEDIAAAGFVADQWVDIESIYSDGVKRVVQSFRIVPYNIPRVASQPIIRRPIHWLHSVAMINTPKYQLRKACL
jgi:anaerobic selenocysteine-containing dehydrogenase